MIIASFPKGSFPANSWPVGTWPAAFIDTTDIQYTEVMEFAVCIAASAEFDVIMPNAGFAEGEGFVATDMVVSGAGSSHYNGTYIETGTKFGKPRYQMPYPNSRGYLFIVWCEYGWFIAPSGLDEDDAFSMVSGGGYRSADDVPTPDLVTTWTTWQDASPVPTVNTATPIPTLTQIVDMYLPMPMVVEFETYEELSL